MNGLKIRAIVAALVIVASPRVFGDDVKFNNQSEIKFSGWSPENFGFGPGYRRAIFKKNDGTEMDIFPLERLTRVGGVLFSGPNGVEISPSGSFAVFLVERVGKLFDSDGHGESAESRQYCPVINTRTGCVVSNLSGQICGGEWDTHSDLWKTGSLGGEKSDTNALLYQGIPNARKMMDEFSRSKKMQVDPKLSMAMRDNFGVKNLVACDPPSKKNVDAYRSIASQILLEGDRASYAYIMKTLGRLR